MARYRLEYGLVRRRLRGWFECGPPAPGSDFFWVDGYWYPVGNRYRWHERYWTRPPYGGARWIAPRHDGERFFDGHWEGDRGRFEHDHRWDRDRDRDWRDRDRR